ncbi:formate dehydrogenase subunit delta [Streptomyces sp. B-S-A8]|uniref:Formate dehydrogenase subunit delta n=1 Tax=Streptomyces solicavernae TaxID=3043614 RepID=A0ABT6RYP7_9ACTN|nr:formate dehydrogenase subunit delta [Streptomyces sp. B-S-A8]MDI3389566.1 formate dehydrogenase subunit delta [Streptomyces sp. B-S-A8]
MAATVQPEERMANQIAANFRHVPGDRAAEAIAAHIRLFWDPRMRRRLLEVADRQADDLDAVVLVATQLLRQPQEASGG